MSIVKYPISVIATFLWVGFICAISFMEAWLKFRADGITLSLGLGIGRLVFSALNKVEWVLAIAILLNQFFDLKSISVKKLIPFFIPFVLLITQTFWLLPALDYRAELIIQGQILPPSNLHFYYVGMEVVKVISLFLFGISLFTLKTKNEG
ncbi:MAG: hypothetical protein CMO34_04035 [Verrucomicrobia bacterium]|nr:hypothetical protein [Verrucomicrobiota bacterium]|tara:strand:- start:2356 stop:2808 length:453 start_codon:yes stop_codon:yes gene_type:complete